MSMKWYKERAAARAMRGKRKRKGGFRVPLRVKVARSMKHNHILVRASEQCTLSGTAANQLNYAYLLHYPTYRALTDGGVAGAPAAMATKSNFWDATGSTFFNGIYDTYRVLGLRVTLTPMINASATSQMAVTANSGNGQIIMSRDADSYLHNATGFQSALNDPQAKVFPLIGGPKSRTQTMSYKQSGVPTTQFFDVNGGQVPVAYNAGVPATVNLLTVLKPYASIHVTFPPSNVNANLSVNDAVATVLVEWLVELKGMNVAR